MRTQLIGTEITGQGMLRHPFGFIVSITDMSHYVAFYANSNIVLMFAHFNPLCRFCLACPFIRRTTLEPVSVSDDAQLPAHSTFNRDLCHLFGFFRVTTTCHATYFSH